MRARCASTARASRRASAGGRVPNTRRVRTRAARARRQRSAPRSACRARPGCGGRRHKRTWRRCTTRMSAGRLGAQSRQRSSRARRCKSCCASPGRRLWWRALRCANGAPSVACSLRQVAALGSTLEAQSIFAGLSHVVGAVSGACRGGAGCAKRRRAAAAGAGPTQLSRRGGGRGLADLY